MTDRKRMAPRVLDGGERRLWPVPAAWRMTAKDCEKVAVEFIEKLKKEGLA